MAESDYERRMEVDHEEELLDFEGSSHGDPSDHEGGATLAKKKKKKKARGKRQVSAPPAFDINRLPSRGPAGLSPTQRQKAVKQQKSKKRVQFSDHVPAVGVTGAAQEAVDEPKEPPSSPVVAPAPTIADLVADAEPAAAPLGSPRQRDAATRKRLTIKIGKRKDQAKQQAVEQAARARADVESARAARAAAGQGCSAQYRGATGTAGPHYPHPEPHHCCSGSKQ